MNSLIQDVRFAVRMLAKSPGFTAIAVITLALGIGANTAIFSLVEALFFGAPPVRDPDRLVRIGQTHAGRNDIFSLSLADYQYLREHGKSFDGLTADYSSSPMNLVAEGQPSSITGAVVTGNYFEVLGLQPALGRFFLPEEDAVPDRNPVAVISHAMWQARFGGDARVLGRSIQLNGSPFTIVGVAPKDYHAIGLGYASLDVWIPAAMFRVGYRYCNAFERTCTIVGVTGRLRQGHTLEEARVELATLAQQLEQSYPQTNKGRGLAAFPVRGLAVAIDARRRDALPLNILVAAVAVVLLIACANLAGLLLARAVNRRKEIAVRIALGANRARLIQQLLTESILLSVIGGALGILVAVWAQQLLLGFYTVDYAGRRVYFDISLNTAVLGFSLGLSLLTGGLFGLIPAMQASRPDVVPALKNDGTMAGGGRSRLRDAMVVAQVALSMVLMIGAGLLIRSVANVFRGPGFDPNPIVLARLRPSLIAYSAEKGMAFQQEVIRRLEATPGVVSASPAQFNASDVMSGELPVWLPGQEPADRENALHSTYNPVGARYFQTIGMSLLEGREFNQRDRLGAPQVAIVNQSLARKLWNRERVVGQTVVADGNQYEVIGLVKDAQYYSLAEAPRPSLYLSYWQQDRSDLWNGDSRMQIRVSGDPQAMLPLIRREIAAVDPAVPMSEFYPMTDRLQHTFASARGMRVMLVSFGALALFLSVIGLYGILAFMVGQRTREIGIRMALGAQSSDVALLVVRRGALLAVVGAVIGLLGAAGATRYLATMLYGVQQNDQATFLAVPAALLLAAMLACWIPARRATRVDPMVALRYE